MAKIQPFEIYLKLLDHYGKQSWWPVSHDFNPKEWEICIGAILTQNTNWRNVEKALFNLKKANCISPNDILKIKENKLQELIRSSGFFKQKAERLKILSNFVLSYGSFTEFTKKVKREVLLQVKGIGPETADSILLYACKKPHFVIDSYTKKMCNMLNIKINKRATYENHKLFFENNLPRDTEIYKEFHALIVQLGKDKFKDNII